MPNRFLNNITINDEYTLPSADGTADQIITTDGAGQLSFVDQSTISAGSSEKVIIYAKNTYTTSIAKGTPVYITGTVGATDTVTIAPADAGNSAMMPAVGILDATLAVNDFGYVITGGFMDNITTDPIDGVTPSSNQTVYVKSGGGLTLTKPTGSQLIQNIAKVGKVSGGNAGSLIVSSILRTNDVPNLTTGKIWVGTATNTAESGVVYLDESNVRMGIGTTSPDKKLEVYTANGTESSIRIRQASQNYWDLKSPASNTSFTISDVGGEKMRITSTGNVGIGETSIDARLHITTATAGLVNQKFESAGSAAWRIGIPASQTYFAFDNVNDSLSAPKVVIDSSGNVGIGTTNPYQKLHIRDTSGANIILNSNTFNVSSGVYMSEGPTATPMQNGSYVYYDAVNDAFKIATGTTSLIDRLTIARDSGALKLNQYGSGAFTGTVTQRLAVDSSGNVIEIPIGSGPVDGSGAANYLARWIDTDTLGIGVAYDNGTNVGIGTTSPASSAKLTVMGNQTFGLPGNGLNTNGRFISIEGNADTSGEGSGRIFFTEHNSTTAGMDSYGMSLGYRGGSTSIVGASGNTWTGLTQIGNGEWGMFGHDNNATGVKIMQGSRSATYTAFYSSGSETMRVTGGNVGIGTTSPAYPLDVTGNVRLTGDLYVNGGQVYTNSVQARVKLGVWSDTTYGIGMQSGYDYGHLSNNYAMTFQFSNTDTRGFWWGDDAHTNSQGAMSLTTIGQATIATSLSVGEGQSITSPSTRTLYVGGDAQITGALYDSNGSAGTVKQILSSTVTGTDWVDLTEISGVDGTGTTNYVAKWSDADTITDSIIYDNGTNVGIGVTAFNTGERFVVSKGSIGATSLNGLNDAVIEGSGDTGLTILSPNTNYGSIAFGDPQNGAIGRIRYQHSTNAMTFNTNGSEYMRIISNGNVGIGTTSPSAKLELSGTSGQLLVLDDSSATGNPFMSFYQAGTRRSYIQHLDAGDLLTLASEYGGIKFMTGTLGTEVDRVVIDSSGNVGILTTTPAYELDVTGTIRATGNVIAFSDARVKENIKTIDSALEKVNKLRGVEFNKIGEEKTCIGVIAQEVEEVLPEVVETDDNGMKAVAYGNMVGLLIEAMKEQQKQIDELKAKLESYGS